jgi:hypothetical protein
MKKAHTIFVSSMTVLLLVLVSCSKEPLTGPHTPQPLPNQQRSPVLPITNSNNYQPTTYYYNYPVDSLTGREFVFHNLNWTLDGIYTVCDIYRPDLFYLLDRPLEVSISINGSEWIYMTMCPYPSDLFFFELRLQATVRIYVYNYTGPLSESTTSVKVRFL